MWTYLSRQGIKVASLNMPQTYPPLEVNGVMVSGYGCPGTHTEFAYPGELKQKILENIPDYDFTFGWQGEKDMHDDNALDAAMINSKKCFENDARLFRLINEEYPWRLMLIQIHQLDRLLHRIWRYITPAYLDQHPKQGEKILDLFSCLDGSIEQMTGRVQGADDLIMFVSDHGHGPAFASVLPNVLLKNWGYLKTHRTSKNLSQRLKKDLGKWLKIKPAKSTKESMNLVDKLQLDWPATRAVVVHSHQMACLYLNVKGRQEGGVVNPGAEYVRLLEELQGRFLAVRDPRHNQPIFSQVITPQKLYGVSDETAVKFGDLLLIPVDGFSVRRSLRRDNFIDYFDDGLRGMHYSEGMFLIHGAQVKTHTRFDADIADIVPTIYAALNVPLPDNLDGKVLQEAFVTPLEIKTASITPDQKPPPRGPGKPLTDQEEQSIQNKLIDLGYL